MDQQADYRHEKIKNSEEQPAFNIYKGENLVAEVRGPHSSNQRVIPMRELNDDEEDLLQIYISNFKKSLNQ